LEYVPPLFLDWDSRDVAFLPSGRSHLDDATDVDDETILASAPNYGVFLIDRESGAVSASMTDLDETHNPVRIATGDVVVCDSGRDRVIRTDTSGVSELLFEGGLCCVKDADPLPGSDRWFVDVGYPEVRDRAEELLEAEEPLAE
jgi:hypothetical protein